MTIAYVSRRSKGQKIFFSLKISVMKQKWLSLCTSCMFMFSRLRHFRLIYFLFYWRKPLHGYSTNSAVEWWWRHERKVWNDAESLDFRRLSGFVFTPHFNRRERYVNFISRLKPYRFNSSITAAISSERFSRSRLVALLSKAARLVRD